MLRLTEKDKIHFFGAIYASNPNDFEFQRGEKKLINELVKYVKQTVDGDEGINKGLHHSQLKDSMRNKNLSKICVHKCVQWVDFL